MAPRQLTSVLDRLIEIAARVATAPAVVESGRTVPYADFLRRVRQFAATFANVEQPRVLIASEKGADTYAAMFGALMAGGTYVPANVAATPTRLAAIREAFAPQIIIASEPLAGWFAGLSDARVIDPSAALPDRAMTSKSMNPIAYVIFTSGSTGVPKGVAIPRVALDHYADWLGPALDIQPGDRMSQHPNIGFDLSVLDIYGALCFGAALYPFVGQQARLLPARKVREDGLTIWNSVPSVVSAMAKARELDAEHFRTVRLFTFCGEVLQADHVAKLFAARPDAIVLNTYGPTEATVAMTCRRLTADAYAEACISSAPIGDAIGDMELHLAGGGDEGEMVLTGPQLAAGYWEDAELTAAKFRDFAHDGVVERAFYTGDFAKRVGADLYFLGRKDEMVKIRGHRIDLGEVRSAFLKLGWPSAFVFERGGALHVVVEKVTGTVFDERQILSDLSTILESYAIPTSIRQLDRLPRNANDKIDGTAVRALVEAAEPQSSPGATRAASPVSNTAPR